MKSPDAGIRMVPVLRRAWAAWLLLIAAESLHGTLRELLLRPYVGDLRARQLALVTGSVIVVGVACGVTRWIRADTPRARWLVGLLWVALTLTFEVSLGRLVLGYSWGRLLEDYDVTRGGWLWLGMIVLLVSPHIAATLRPPPARQVWSSRDFVDIGVGPPMARTAYCPRNPGNSRPPGVGRAGVPSALEAAQVALQFNDIQPDIKADIQEAE